MFHLFTILTLLPAAYVYWSLIHPLSLRKRWKVLSGVILVLSSLKNEVLSLFGGPMFFAPELPGWFLILLSLAFNTLLMLFFLSILKDLARGILFIAGALRGRRIRMEKHAGICAAAVTGIGLLLGIFGTYSALAVPEVRKETLMIENLPEGLENLRIALVADIHCSAVNREPLVRAIAERVNALRPDLIFLLGDLVDGTPEQRLRDLLPLSTLRAEYGVYAVPGNHEFFSGWEKWQPIYREWDFRLLLNRGELLTIRGAPLYIAGVSDRAAKRFGLEGPDPEQAMRGCPAGTVAFLLDHRPGSAASNAELPVSAQFSGHTHGGMIAGIGESLIGSCNGGFAGGWYSIGKSRLYVSRGSSLWNGFIFRLGVPSEITLLTLKKGTNRS